MNKVSLKELTRQLQLCEIGLTRDTIEYTPLLGVYHRHEWDHGYGTTYGYNGSRRAFYADMREMMGFLIDYYNISDTKEIIIAPCYRYNQFDERYYYFKEMPGVDIFDEIRKFLRKQGVRRSDRTGIKIPVLGNDSILEMLLEGSFRGVSEFCLFSFENKVLIEPNHHFDLAFWTHEFDEVRGIINGILPKYPNLNYYDMYTREEAKW